LPYSLKNYAERARIKAREIVSYEEMLPRSYLHSEYNHDMSGYKKYFVKTINAVYGAEAAPILNELESNNELVAMDTSFAAKSPNPVDRRLDFCAYFLSLIITLDRLGESYEKIRTVCLQITIEYVKPKNKLQAMMKRIPAKLTNTWISKFFLKSFRKKIEKKGHTEGFLAEIITDKKETYGLGYGINILECGICKLFKKHNYEKYASILCEVDEITSGMAGLKLIRSGTIARGSQICDFRYKKI
jgi:hypothetical protein